MRPRIKFDYEPQRSKIRGRAHDNTAKFVLQSNGSFRQ